MEAWRITYSPEWDGWLVSINGKRVMDEHGAPSVYRPPNTVTCERDYDRWRLQVCQSIARMSGVECDPRKITA